MDNATLNFLYQNVRGLRTKTQAFSSNLLTIDHDIILITETWLNSGILDSELVSGNFSVIRRDRGSNGGGVMIICSERISVRSRPDWQRDHLDVECLWVTIEGSTIKSDNDLHIALAYMPPDLRLPERIIKLKDWISDIMSSAPNDHFMVAGDFNLPCVQWNDKGPVYIKKGSVELQHSALDFVHNCYFLGLQQSNFFNNSSGNTLDLIFCNFNVNISKCLTPLVREDIFHITLHIDACDITVAPLIKPLSKKIQFRRACYTDINEIFSVMDWSDLYLGTVEEAVSNFYNKVNDVILKHIPQITVHGSHQYPVWFTKALINVNKEKNRVHSRWKRYKNPRDYDEFSCLRSRFKRLEALCYKNYITRSQELIKSNPKLLWSFVKSKKKSATRYPSVMTYNTKKLTSSNEIVQSFNSYFQQMFTQQQSIRRNDISLPAVSSSSQGINMIVISEEQVLKVLRQLDPHKGPGSDNLPPFFFKQCAESLYKPVTIIFNRSIREGNFPHVWKQAHIVPLHKKGSKSHIENYRPISILNVLSKCLEKIIYESIYPTIAQSIPEQQHGFIKGRSTTSNLGVFVSDVLKGMELHAQVDVIYTDFEKAFDRVDHVILLRKLQELGIQGDLLRWVQSYVGNRSQAVVVGGARSDFITITSGIPQGSLLGPLFYSAYLYDIGSCFLNTNFLLYADDKKVYYKVRDINDCLRIQDDLDRLNTYYKNNRIDVNVDKCISISFTRSRNPIIFVYTLNNNIIKKQHLVRDLGIFLDDSLTFTSHVEHIVDKAYRNLGFILRVTKPFTSILCLKVLYFAYVRSILDYCSQVWNPQYLIYENAIESIQRKFVKHLDFRSNFKFETYETSCQRHGLLTLRNRRILNDMSLFHDICSGALDCSVLTNNVLALRAPSRRTRHTKLFHVPTHRTNYSANSLTSRMPRTFNKLFGDLDPFCTSKNIFKTAVTKAIKEKHLVI